jgi:hypothetical protein
MNASMPYPARSGVGKVLFFLAALALLAGAVALTSPGMAHAVERHGDDAFTVSHCLNEHGAMQTWLNKDTGRHAEVCQVGPEKFGIRISVNELKDTITQFIKNKMTRIDQVEQYLMNRGYVCISGC